MRLVEGYFVGEALGTHMLEDLSEPLTVYQVVQERPAHTRFDVAMTRGLTPLVGREHEVGLLRERWAQATDGRGQVVVLSGEAGIGKSRLVQAFTEYLAGERIRGRVPLFTLLPAHGLLSCRDVIPAALAFRPGEIRRRSSCTNWKALRAVWRGPGGGGALVGGTALAAAAGALYAAHPDARAQQQKTLEALLTWLLAEAERQPVCVLVEDLHWADASTLEWLSAPHRPGPHARCSCSCSVVPSFPCPGPPAPT